MTNAPSPEFKPTPSTLRLDFTINLSHGPSNAFARSLMIRKRPDAKCRIAWRFCNALASQTGQICGLRPQPRWSAGKAQAGPACLCVVPTKEGSTAPSRPAGEFRSLTFGQRRCVHAEDSIDDSTPMDDPQPGQETPSQTS